VSERPVLARRERAVTALAFDDPADTTSMFRLPGRKVSPLGIVGPGVASPVSVAPAIHDGGQQVDGKLHQHMRVLFTTPAGLGHIHPTVPLAQAMVARGHDVLGPHRPMASTTSSGLGSGPCPSATPG